MIWREFAASTFKENKILRNLKHVFSANGPSHQLHV